MAYVNVLDDIKKCIKFEIPEQLPVIALTEEFDAAQSGMTYEEYSASEENAARVHIQGIEKFNYDWACVYIDDCLEFEPLGVKTTGSDNIPRAVSRFLPAMHESINKLEIPDPTIDGRMPVQLGAIRRIKQRFGDTVFICGRTPAPFSAVTLLFGIEQTMMLIYDEPELLQDAMKFFIDVETSYAKAQIQAGANALWIGDCSSSSRFLSVELFKRFAAQPAAELISRLKAMNAATIYFAAEKSVQHLVATSELGADIIGLSEDADIAECKRVLNKKACLMGNLDPINVVYNGTPESVESEVNRIISSAGNEGGFLFNTGEGIPRDTSVENVKAIIKALRGGSTLILHT
ncbi:MAG: hypothetical protein FIA99_02580 [Ruminiclostridium sp.]|nr:hypothetical protein [Ruminiclostridium sp.]